MRTCFASAAALLCVAAGAQGAAAADCSATGGGLGVSRVVRIDASRAPVYGSITRLPQAAAFLRPREVVLTFDDGPHPTITRSVLATLDAFCTKATFFPVGRVAVQFPNLVAETVRRGHTVGSHTWSHPLNVGSLTFPRATDELERGFTAVALAARVPIAPFFRFPGLNDSPLLLAHMQSRGVAVFSVDVVSDDSFTADPDVLVRNTIRRLEARGRGILLFHDIKSSTARALPKILAALKAKGYRVVHLAPARSFQPLPSYWRPMARVMARRAPASGKAGALVAAMARVRPDSGASTALGRDSVGVWSTHVRQSGRRPPRRPRLADDPS
ncbi:MAG: polysaccharide deacetylase family protein [Hyphomicrobiaceae bacterium]